MCVVQNVITNPEASIPSITKVVGGHSPESFAPQLPGSHNILPWHETIAILPSRYLGTYTRQLLNSQIALLLLALWMGRKVLCGSWRSFEDHYSHETSTATAHVQINLEYSAGGALNAHLTFIVYILYMIWYDMIRYDIWYDMIWYMIWYDM